MTRPPSADELKKVFAEAAEIAQSVPQNLQEAAFQRALDALLSPRASSAPGPAAPTTQRAPAQNSPPERASTDQQVVEQDPVELLMEQLDRTELAQVMAGRKVLDRALLVLRAAHHHGIDALTPAEIAEVLTQKFRERTTDAAVRMAIGNETEYVDRVRQGTGFGYRLMASGERYLDTLSSSSGAAPATAQRKRSAPRKRATSADKTAAQSVGESAAPVERSRPRRAVGRPGPKAMVETLISDGYFKERRLLGDILTHLEQKRGFKYTAQDIAPALARLLREQKLDRERDPNGQYSYRKPD